MLQPEPQAEFPPQEVAPTHPVVRQLKLKLHDMHLKIIGMPSVTKTEYFIQVAAHEDVMMYWAEKMGMPKRLSTPYSRLVTKEQELTRLDPRPDDYAAQMKRLKDQQLVQQSAHKYPEFGCADRQPASA